MGSDDVLDMLLLIVVLAILSPIMVANSITMFRGDVGGFDTLIDKTAQQTSGEIIPSARTLTRADILLMAIVADRKAPRPAVLQSIANGDPNPTEIKISDILSDRNNKLRELERYLPSDNTPLQIQTYIGIDGPRKWVISRK